MAVTQNDLKFYLTQIEPLQDQADVSQSVGGYPSDTLAFPYTTLSASLDRVSTSATVASADAVLGKSILVIDDEFVFLASQSGTSLTLGARGLLGTDPRIHASGALVLTPGVTDLFGNDFDVLLKQYRCLALQNTNATDTAFNVSVYLKYPSLNPTSTIKMAVEVPNNDSFTGAVTSATNLSVTDSSISTSYADNSLDGAVVKFTSGALSGRYAVIRSYDHATKTMVFTASLASSPLVGVTYNVYSGPSQRVISGEVKPLVGVDRVTAFATPTTAGTSQSINVNGHRVNTTSLRPGDVVYVWLERSLLRNANAFNNNRVILAVRYSTT